MFFQNRHDSGMSKSKRPATPEFGRFHLALLQEKPQPKISKEGCIKPRKWKCTSVLGWTTTCIIEAGWKHASGQTAGTADTPPHTGHRSSSQISARWHGVFSDAVAKLTASSLPLRSNKLGDQV